MMPHSLDLSCIFRKSPCQIQKSHGRKAYCLVFVIGFMMISGQTLASESHKPFQEIARLVKNDQWSRAWETAQSNDERYFIEWMALDRGRDVENSELYALGVAHPDWPSQDRLRKKVEPWLAKNGSNTQIEQWFADYDPADPDTDHDLLYRYLNHLMENGQYEKAQSVAEQWWPIANIPTNQQAQAFHRFKGLLDTQTHRARLHRLIEMERYKGAQGLAALLGESYQKLVRARLALKGHASGANGMSLEGTVAAVPASLRSDAGLLMDRIEWRLDRENYIDATALFKTIPTEILKEDPSGWWTLHESLIRSLLRLKKYDEALALARSIHYPKPSAHEGQSEKNKLADKIRADYTQSEWLAGWVLLQYGSKSDIQNAYQRFVNLSDFVQKPASRARAAFWAGRAASALGRNDVAQQHYVTAAKNPTNFYGQLAAVYIPVDQRPRLGSDLQTDLERQIAVEKTTNVQIARALAANNMPEEAADFLLRYGYDTNDIRDYYALANIAEDLGLIHVGVSIARLSEQKSVPLLRYAYPTMVRHSAKKAIEPSLIHAIIRQESNFKTSATSSAGARGLMQLMPTTAQETARKIGASYHPENLKNPDYNITLGSTYFRQLLNRYNQSIPLAAAAYNAGMGRVDKWLKENGNPLTGDIEMLNWIELIPYRETRSYVQHIMENQTIYKTKF
jgi:soluble lytic murein transglycosylase